LDKDDSGEEKAGFFCESGDAIFGDIAKGEVTEFLKNHCIYIS
jgi:hypothetical protein